jgi:MFS family permease
MLRWYVTLNKSEKSTFWACFGGWALDAMDTQMYALVLPTLIVLWGMSTSEAGILGTAVLVFAALGGWIAGVLADRYGRVKILQLTIIWFAVFTGLSGLTNSFEQLLITRSLQGLGFGGEWAVGSVLISEAINARLRGRVVGTLQAGWAVGYGIAVLLTTILFQLLPADTAWRVLFFIGVAPALLVIWIRRNIPESEVYKTTSDVQKAASSPWAAFGAPYRRTMFKAVLLTFGIYGGNYVMITWLPAYLKLVLGLSISGMAGYLAVNILGSFTGAFLNGWMADAVGRRKTFIIIACCQAVTVAIYTMAPIDRTTTLLLGFVLGTLQSGTAAGTGAFLAELFPTHIRAAAQGISGNAGRAFGALMPALVGVLSMDLQLAVAMGMCACASYVMVVLAALLLPETRGRDLNAIGAEMKESESREPGLGPVVLGTKDA